MIDEENPERAKAAQAFAQKQQFDQQMLANLKVTSRTSKGVSDTSSSADKPKLSREGTELARHSMENFQRGLALAWEHRHDAFEDGQQMWLFLEQLAATVSDGLLKDGQSLWRTWNTKFNQTSPDKIPQEVDEFCQELAHRLQEKADSITTVAWIEQRFDNQIHPLADGCSRTTKLLSGMVLARSEHSLPQYRNRDEYYQNIEKPFPEWEAYYRTLFGKENS